MTAAGRRSPVGSTIGEQVKLARERRGFSISELARRSGISKAALSGIEAGNGNPTVGTLDVLAVTLAVPLADLICIPRPTTSVHVRARERSPDSTTRELLQRLPGTFGVEIWRLRIPPGRVVHGSPHLPGTVETLVVAQGDLVAGTNDEPTSITRGDCLTFPGDQPHSYRSGDTAVDVTVIIASPQALLQRSSLGGRVASL